MKRKRTTSSPKKRKSTKHPIDSNSQLWKYNGRDWQLLDYVGLRTIDKCRKLNLTPALDSIKAPNLIAENLKVHHHNCTYIIATIENFFSAEECDKLKETIENFAEPDEELINNLDKVKKSSKGDYSDDDDEKEEDEEDEEEEEGETKKKKEMANKKKDESFMEKRRKVLTNTKFQKMQNIKQIYDSNVRSGRRLVFLEQELSTIIWDRLHSQIDLANIFDEKKITQCPRGFSVLPESNWKISGVNECLRVNLYQEKNHFGVHRDAQYCPNANKRSLLTGILYLSDDFDGGETICYFPKVCKCGKITCPYKSKDEDHIPHSYDYTISEEIRKINLDENFHKFVFTPKKGSLLIISQPLLHSGEFVTKGDKWIMKFDILTERSVCKKGDIDLESDHSLFDRRCLNCSNSLLNDISDQSFKSRRFGCSCQGFQLDPLEKSDYQNALLYFREAQSNELQKSKLKANNLYERCLSLRYSYPHSLIYKLENNIQNENDKEGEKDGKWFCKNYFEKLPWFAWNLIFDYLGERGAKNFAEAFPNPIGFFQLEWERLLTSRAQSLNLQLISRDNQFENEEKKKVENEKKKKKKEKKKVEKEEREEIINNIEIEDEELLKMIPILLYTFGVISCFKFTDKNFFEENLEQCLKVAAVYSFTLLGQSKRPIEVEGRPNQKECDKRDTRSELERNRIYTVRFDPESGSVVYVPLVKLLNDVFYNRKSFGYIYSVYQQEQKRRDPVSDFISSVDRTYMNLKHAKENIGIDFVKIFDEAERKNQIDNLIYPKGVSVDVQPIGSEEFYIKSLELTTYNIYTYLFGYDYFDFPSETVDKKLYNYHKKLNSFLNNKNKNKKKKSEVGGALIANLNRVHHNFHLCPIGDDEYVNSNSDFRMINHLVFDFENQQLNVIEGEFAKGEENIRCDCTHLFHFAKEQTENDAKRNGKDKPEVKNYRVDITSLMKQSEGFNHASCQCSVPDVPFDHFFMLRYPLLDHIHFMIVKNDDDVLVYALYNGIVAL